MTNNLKTMPVVQLLALHNQHAPRPLKSFKGKRSELVCRTLAVLPAKKPKGEPKPKGRTIKDATVALLCTVDYYEDKTKPPSADNRIDHKHPNAGSVGLSYSDIVKTIKLTWLGSKTTEKTVRHYNSHINNKRRAEYDDLKLPRRRP